MKISIITVLLLILILCPSMQAYSWTNYKNVRYMDVDGDLADEIIIEAEHGAGSNHYIEDMRIFKDKYPELELIFSIRTLDSSFGFYGKMKQYNLDIVSEVEFTKPNSESGVRDIIVHSKKIYYKDSENKIIDREKDLGVKVYKWNGSKYEKVNQ